MRNRLGRTALLAVLLALLCAACVRTGEGGGNGGNDIEQITTGGGKETEDSGEASIERVEVSTLATNLEVPWSFAFLPGMTPSLRNAIPGGSSG